MARLKRHRRTRVRLLLLHLRARVCDAGDDDIIVTHCHWNEADGIEYTNENHH